MLTQVNDEVNATYPPWIPVEDALPPDGEWVLFIVDDDSDIAKAVNGKVLGGYFSLRNQYFYTNPERWLYEMYRGSHWMPAPQPPSK